MLAIACAAYAHGPYAAYIRIYTKQPRGVASFVAPANAGSQLPLRIIAPRILIATGASKGFGDVPAMALADTTLRQVQQEQDSHMTQKGRARV